MGFDDFPGANVEQLEAGFRNAVQQFRDGAEIGEALDAWGIPDDCDIGLPAVIAWRRCCGAWRILAIAGPQKFLGTWIEMLERLGAGAVISDDMLAELVVLLAQEAGGLAVESVDDLPIGINGPGAESLMYLIELASVLVDAIELLGGTRDKAFMAMAYGIDGEGPPRIPEAIDAVIALRCK